MNEPRQLKNETQVPAALRQDLERVQGLAPRAYDMQAGLARLHTGIAATASSAAIKTAIWPWVTAAGVVSATLLGVVAMRAPQLNAPTSSVSATPGPITSVVAHVPPVAPLRIVAPAIPVESDDSVAASPVDPDALLRLETTNLAHAREALLDSPHTALRLAQQGERRFAGGMFGQERQAIIVLSSLRLAQPSAAANARAFLDSYPRSPLADRIRDELSRAPGQP
jgi:hypothetical protein